MDWEQAKRRAERRGGVMVVMPLFVVVFVRFVVVFALFVVVFALFVVIFVIFIVFTSVFVIKFEEEDAGVEEEDKAQSSVFWGCGCVIPSSDDTPALGSSTTGISTPFSISSSTNLSSLSRRTVVHREVRMDSVRGPGYQYKTWAAVANGSSVFAHNTIELATISLVTRPGWVSSACCSAERFPNTLEVRCR